MPDNEEIIESTEPEINVIPSGVGNFKIEKYPRVMFVNSSTDELADAVNILPGTIVYTYGFGTKWQVNDAGEFIECNAETPAEDNADAEES